MNILTASTSRVVQYVSGSHEIFAKVKELFYVLLETLMKVVEVSDLSQLF